MGSKGCANSHDNFSLVFELLFEDFGLEEGPFLAQATIRLILWWCLFIPLGLGVINSRYMNITILNYLLCVCQN